MNIFMFSKEWWMDITYTSEFNAERYERFAFCGHIHTGDHNPLALEHSDGSVTTLRNVSRLDEEYQIRFEPYVFEI